MGDVIRLEDVIKSIVLEADPQISRKDLVNLIDKYYSRFVSAVVAMELE